MNLNNRKSSVSAQPRGLCGYLRQNLSACTGDARMTINNLQPSVSAQARGLRGYLRQNLSAFTRDARMNIRMQDRCRKGIPRTTKPVRGKLLREGFRIQVKPGCVELDCGHSVSRYL